MSEPRDYSNYELEEDHAEYVHPHILRFMLTEMSRHNFRYSWVLDHSHGIEEIAYFGAEYLPSFPYERDLISKGQRRPVGDPEQDRISELARGFKHAVYLAIEHMIEDGYLEFELSLGWPCIRLTRAALAIPQYFEGMGGKNHAERIDELRRMPYGDYLQTEEWRYRREMHIEAAGERCQLCNSDQQPLHVHHRTYANRGRENFYDLVALCGPCHEWFHKSGRKVR